MTVLCLHWEAIDRDTPFAPRPRSLWLGQTKDVAQDRTNSPDRVPAVGSHQRNRACQMPNCIYGRPFSQSPARTGPVTLDHWFMITPRRHLSPMRSIGVGSNRMHNEFDITTSHVMIDNITAPSDQAGVPRDGCNQHESTRT
jgi:hypothetical protein